MDATGPDGVLGRALSGDAQAFAEIYRDVQPRLLRYLSVQSRQHAEDVCADTWLEVVRCLDQFDGDLNGFRAWVFRIGRNRLVDALRRQGRRPLHLVEVAEELDGLRRDGASDPDPAELVVAAEATREALALIRTLPPDQAEALMLRVVGGLDYPEVASIMGRSQGAVRVLAHRGLRRLAAASTVVSSADHANTPRGGVTG